MKKLINIWSSRGLSICGKVTLIKTLLISKFIFVASLLPTPENVVKDLNRLIYKFLWKGPDKVEFQQLTIMNEEVLKWLTLNV